MELYSGILAFKARTQLGVYIQRDIPGQGFGRDQELLRDLKGFQLSTGGLGGQLAPSAASGERMSWATWAAMSDTAFARAVP